MTADIHTLTGAYAADALDDDERRFFERHLDDCDACAQEVAELQATAARLGAAVAVPPPPDLRARVLAEVAHTRQDSPRSRTGAHIGRERRRARWLLPAAAFALLTVVASAAVTHYRGEMTALEQHQARVDAVMAAPDMRMVESHGEDGAMARAVVSASMGEAVLVVDRMAPAPSDHTYGLWLMAADGARPAGRLDVDETGRTTQLLSGDFDDAYAIGVTVEPMDGSTRPAGEPVMMLELGT